MDTSLLPVQSSQNGSDAATVTANSSTGQTRRVFNPNRSVQQIDQAALESILQRNGPEEAAGDRTVEFSFDSEANRVVVKVKSQDGEVVRQIPPDDYLKFVSKFKEMIGVLFDETA